MRQDELEGVEAAHEWRRPERMTDVLLVVAGGALGVLLRYLLDAAFTGRFGIGFPWATLTINVVGAFALGVLTVLTVERGLLPMQLRPALGIGFLGGFTTFSTYAVDAFLLAEAGYIGRSLTYAVLTNIAGLGAAALGFLLARTAT